MLRVLRNTDPGAPVMNGLQGTLINFLDYVLLTGYHTISVDTITSSGVVATVHVADAHEMDNGMVVEISGADQAEYNGLFKINNCTNNAFEYTLLSAAPVTTATGIISSTIASLGWVGGLSDINKKVYSPASGFPLYKIDENPVSSINITYGGGTRHARVFMYESMLDVDHGIPDNLWNSYIYKSRTQDDLERAWIVIGDGETAYIFISHSTSIDTDQYYSFMAFGKYTSFVANDSFNYLLMAKHGLAPVGESEDVYLQASNEVTDQYSSALILYGCGKIFTATQKEGSYLLRNRILQEGLTAFLLSNAVSSSEISNWVYSMTNLGLFNKINAEKYYRPVLLFEPDAFRGYLSGVYYGIYPISLPTPSSTSIISNCIINGTPRDILTIRGGSAILYCIDITGPWGI